MDPQAVLPAYPATSSGVWRATTSSGAVYLLDYAAGTVTRESEGASLRRDGEPLILRKADRCTLGQSLYMVIGVLNGFNTLRATTPLVTLESLD